MRKLGHTETHKILIQLIQLFPRLYFLMVLRSSRLVIGEPEVAASDWLKDDNLQRSRNSFTKETPAVVRDVYRDL